MLGLENLPRQWVKIVAWAVVLGVLASVLADWGRWDRFPLNLLWRVLITALGGVIGLVLDHFASVYVGMGTNVIESTGMVRFSEDTYQKIQNSFIAVCAIVAAILAFIFIR
jgi:hypothetical protein